MSDKKQPIEPMKNPDRIINYWKKEKFIVGCIVFSGITYNVGMLAGPVFQGKLIDALAQGKNIQVIITIATVFVLTISIVQALRYMKRYYIRRFANDTSATMRFMLYNNVMFKQERELEQENLGNLMTKAISDVDGCVEGMRKFTTEVFDTGVLLITYMISMLLYDWKLTLVSCAFTPIAFVCAEKLKKIIYSYTTEYRKQNGVISDIAYDRIENALLYRIYGREIDNYNAYKEELADFEHKAVIANVWGNTMQPLYNVIAMVGVIVVITIGGANVTNGIWTIGIFSTYISIFATMAIKTSKAAKLFNSIQKAQVSWKRIKPYFSEYQEMAMDKSIDGITDDDNTCVNLTIRNLTFAYPDGDSIINGIDITANAGDFVGVTGPVACGKSTFGKIFLGEYQYGGHLFINGKELKSYSDCERCNLVSYMGHNPHLISDTVYNNITLGDDGDISAILRIVCVEEDMKNLKDGIDTVVGNGGAKLSGGQQARVALARTLYHHKKIIVLDDPFSAVDVNTERQIIENIKDGYKDSIVIVISHRFSIFAQMYQIVLINSVGQCQYGTHEELMNNSTVYRELFNLQMGKEGENDD